MKILLIDNFDSFIYNLDYGLRQSGHQVTVVRNDLEFEPLCLLAQQADAIVISPGPGNPAQAGHCLAVIKQFKESKPILGVCLGHQAIVEACGGVIDKAEQVVHGKTSTIQLQADCPLFDGLPEQLSMARYHSLVASKVPAELVIVASSDDQQVMAVAHQEYPIYGVQFHPESIMSVKGAQLLNNFIAIAQQSAAKAKEQSHDAVA